MVFQVSWIKHRLCNSQLGNVIHILQKTQISPINGPKELIGGDYKFLTGCSIIILSFSNQFLSCCCYHWRFIGDFLCIL